jgi:hypothetical protein
MDGARRDMAGDLQPARRTQVFHSQPFPANYAQASLAGTCQRIQERHPVCRQDALLNCQATRK